MSALTKRRISIAAIVLAAVLYLEAGQVLGWDPSLFSKRLSNPMGG